MVSFHSCKRTFITDTTPIGWSFGGVVAYEVSLQLAKQGVRVQGVLLIDSPSPIDHVPLSDSVIDSVLSPEARKSGNKLGKLVKAQFVMNTRMLGRYVPRTTDEYCPTLVFLRSREGYNPSNMLEVPAWLADRQDPKLISASWETIAGEPIKVIDIPGHHFQPFETSNVRDLLPSSQPCNSYAPNLDRRSFPTHSRWMRIYRAHKHPVKRGHVIYVLSTWIRHFISGKSGSSCVVYIPSKHVV